MASNLTIGKLARQTGLNPKTIRYYEEVGLVPAPPRNESGYRLYSEKDARVLEIIRQARSLGFSIRQVRELLGIARHEICGSFQGEVAKRVVSKLEEVDDAIRRLTRLRGELTAAMQALGQEGCQEASVLECTDCRCLG